MVLLYGGNAYRIVSLYHYVTICNLTYWWWRYTRQFFCSYRMCCLFLKEETVSMS